MSPSLNLLAYDFGAESGRAILGKLSKGKLAIETLHRFSNTPSRINGTLYWNVLEQFRDMCVGLGACKKAGIKHLHSIGIDTWGVDFGILDKNGALLGNPVHYRDPRNAGMMEKVFEVVPREKVYKETGLQFMQFNTIFQLYAMALAKSPQLEVGRRILMMSDLLNYFFSGIAAQEFSVASTTQLMNPRTGSWSAGLMKDLGIPRHLFGAITPSAWILGGLRKDVAEDAGWPQAAGASVIAALGHDTGAAVAAVPALSADGWCYISSGTWSLMGAELDKPCISAKTLEYNFTNEGGLGGTTRFLKNIAGLWLVQQCRAQWEREGKRFSYPEIVKEAAKAPALVSLIDPDRPEFMPAGDMPARIAATCLKTGEPVPDSRGAVVRCALESLAMRYRWVLERLEECLRRRFDTIHIVGGGTQNELLNQMTADATGRHVVAGPVEATAIGNLLAQAIALKAIGSHAEGRRIIARSFPVKTYEPQKGRGKWDERYRDFLKILKK